MKNNSEKLRSIYRIHGFFYNRRHSRDNRVVGQLIESPTNGWEYIQMVKPGLLSAFEGEWY